MGWLTELTGQQLGVLGGSFVIIAVTIAYVIKFQAAFTSKLEEKGARDEAAIKALTDLVAKLQAQVYESGERSARYRRALITRGIDPDEELRNTP